MPLTSLSMLLAAAATLIPGGSCPSPAPRVMTTAECAAFAPVGEPFTGDVVQVLDGRTICVSQGAEPSAWVKLRLADASGAADRPSLMAAAFGRDVVCVASEHDERGLVAHC